MSEVRLHIFADDAQDEDVVIGQDILCYTDLTIATCYNGMLVVRGARATCRRMYVEYKLNLSQYLDQVNRM